MSGEAEIGRPRRRPAAGLVAAAVAALILLPAVLPPLWLNVAVFVLLATLGVQGLNLLTGMMGQVSLGNAAFMAIGGFGVVFAVEKLGLGFLPSLVVAGVFSAAVGGIVSLSAFRVRGFYLVLATIALLYCVQYLLLRYQYAEVGNSSFSLPIPTIAGFELSTDLRWYYLSLLLVLLVTAGLWNLQGTRFGRAAAMVREQETACGAFGIPPKRLKTQAFVWSSGLIGVQGGLLAYFIGFLSAETLTLDTSIQYLAMVVVAGLGVPWAAIIGAAYVVALPTAIEELGRSVGGIDTSFVSNLNLLVYGLSIVVFIHWLPGGVAELMERLGSRFGLVRRR